MSYHNNQSRSEPVCVMITCNGLVSLFDKQYTWQKVLNQIISVYPKCSYIIREYEPGTIIKQCYQQTPPSFCYPYSYKVTGCYLIPGSIWQLMVRYNAGVPFQDCYKLPTHSLDSIEEIDAHISTWLKTTLNKKQFLEQQPTVGIL